MSDMFNSVYDEIFFDKEVVSIGFSCLLFSITLSTSLDSPDILKNNLSYH